MRILYFLLPLLALAALRHNNDTRVTSVAPVENNAKIITGAEQLEAYLPLLKGKKVGMLVNQTSIIGKRSLVDSLHTLGVDIRFIFGPEHGFRVNASNGAEVADEIDAATGIPIVSLYGNKRRPTKKEMATIDVMIFDIQDVGCRFYTYINTLREIMEACAESGKDMLILDRPNPNGYVDGPVLDMKLSSGIGRFPVPITHGMTIGEFAQMIRGQEWMEDAEKCKLNIIPLKNYRHNMDYILPSEPSPNLNTQQSILLYPSLCLFEGTIISQGRGTYIPFTVLGSPDLKGLYNFNFTPVSLKGKSEAPLHQDKVCYGLDLRKYDMTKYRKEGKINIQWMIDLYKIYPAKEKFFDSRISRAMGNIDILAGTTAFKEQIIAGKTEDEIRRSWEPGLSAYKKMRMKYVIYADN